MPINEYGHETPIEPGRAKRPQEAIGYLLPLDTGVVAGAIPRLMQLVVRGCSEELVVVGKNPFIMTQVAVGSVEVLMIRAPRKAPLGVINHPCPVHHRA